MSYYTMLSKYGNCMRPLKEAGKTSRYFVGVFDKKNIYIFHSHLLVWDDYSQLGVTRLFGYLPSHIQSALVE